jgi:hypothetical protein
MSESVDILIKAEDLATPVIKQSAKAVDGLDAGLKRIKESGGQAKKSADFARIIASSLGGSEIGSYIGQMGEAAEKTAQFAEIQKAGGAGALAFKAGLVGLVGTIAFGVGKAIGDAVFQTEKWTQQLTEAASVTKGFDSDIAKLRATMNAERMEDIELIRDPEKKRASYTAMLQALKTEMRGVEDAIKQGTKENEAFAKSWNYLGNDIAINEATKATVETNKERLKVMKDEARQLKSMIDDRAVLNERLKEENALQDKSEAYVETLRQQLEVLKATNDEKAQVIASQNTVDTDFREARNLLKEIDAINAKAAADKIAADEKKRADTENENNAKRLKALKENELIKLQQEKILLDQGREAANAFALEKQGLAKADAAAIAREREQIDLRKDAIKEAEKQGGTKPLGQQPTVNTAFESRLLTRGPADDAAKFTAQNTANALAELKMMNARQERMEKEANRQKGRTTTLTVVKGK